MNLGANGLVDIAEEGESMTNWESSTDTDTLSWVKQWEVAIQHREPSLVLCDDLKGWDGGGEGGSRERGVCVLSCFTCVWLSATLWTAAHQTSLSVVLSKWESWSGSPRSLLGVFPTQALNQPRLFFCTGDPHFSPTHENWETPSSREETQKVSEPVKTDLLTPKPT